MADHDPQIDRRRFIAGTTTVGLGAVAGWSAARPSTPADASALAPPAWDPALGPTCTLTPFIGQGPFYLDLRLLRSDITEGIAGAPMALFVCVTRADDCTPIADAVVDVWHTDPLGRYSGIESEGTAGETWMRGIQTTRPDGLVRFDTLYPGWYVGRTPHVHVKVFLGADTLVTTQLYVPQPVTDRVYEGIAPYTERGPADTTNAQDAFYDATTEMRVVRAPAGAPGVWAGITIAVAP